MQSLHRDLRLHSLSAAHYGELHLVTRLPLLSAVREEIGLPEVGGEAVEADQDVAFLDSGAMGDGVFAVLANVLNEQP